MSNASDMELLRAYARQSSETAFAALVTRHISLVYSVALRHVRISAHAEEITQAVFIILAAKAGTLRPDTVLEAWLYHTARLTSLSFVRAERRRRLREQEAYMQSTLHGNDPAENWHHLEPLLDDAMARLDKSDREALVLRFLKEKSLREVAVALEITETAAQSRVYRAVEKLRGLLTKRGLALPATVLTATLSAHSVQAAPLALAKSVTATALSKGVAITGASSLLVAEASKAIAWAKMKTVLVTGALILFSAGTITVTVKTIREHMTAAWQTPRAQARNLAQAPAEVRIVPSKYSEFGGWGYDRREGDKKVIGIGAPVRELLQAAYGMPATRMVFTATLPAGRYDFIANLPAGSQPALQKEIERTFKLIGRKEMRSTAALILTRKNPAAPGLRPTTGNNSRENSILEPGRCVLVNESLSALAEFLENYFETPVIDGSKSTARFDISLRWNEQELRKNPEGLKQVLRDDLGLELEKNIEPIEMLIVTNTP